MKKKFSLAAILAVFVALGWYSKEKFCAQYPNEPLCVAPTPAPSPTATPVPLPTPTATPEPQPTPSPTPGLLRPRFRRPLLNAACGSTATR